MIFYKSRKIKSISKTARFLRWFILVVVSSCHFKDEAVVDWDVLMQVNIETILAEISFKTKWKKEFIVTQCILQKFEIAFIEFTKHFHF